MFPATLRPYYPDFNEEIFSALPAELVELILGYSDTDSAMVLASLSQEANDLVNNPNHPSHDFFWGRCLERDFGISNSSHPKDNYMIELLRDETASLIELADWIAGTLHHIDKDNTEDGPMYKLKYQLIYAKTINELLTAHLSLKSWLHSGKRTRSGNTILHLSRLTTQPIKAQVLVLHGIDVNITDGNGYTTLQLAARDNQITMIKFLLQVGADPMLANQSLISAAKNWAIENPNGHFTGILICWTLATSIVVALAILSLTESQNHNVNNSPFLSLVNLLAMSCCIITTLGSMAVFTQDLRHTRGTAADLAKAQGHRCAFKMLEEAQRDPTRNPLRFSAQLDPDHLPKTEQRLNVFRPF